MGITKALGGDRINSGKEMDVHLHSFATSRHNITKTVRTNQAVGTCVPIYSRLLLKDNKLELDINASCFTNPTEGPAFAEYDVHINVFSAPLRLYQADLAINLLEEGENMDNVKFPLIKFTADKIDWAKNPDNQQIGSSCVHKYLGTRGLGDALNPETQSEVTRYRNANNYLMYVDNWAQYYSVKPEGIGYVIHYTGVTRTVTQVRVFEGVTVIGTVPENTGDTPIIINTDRVVTINYVGDKPRWEDIYIYIGAVDGKPAGAYPITEIFQAIQYQEGGGTTWIECSTTFNYPNSMSIRYWRYKDADEEGVPQLYEFPLANINRMRRDILKANETEAFIIDEESIAPYGLSLKKYDKWAKLSNQEGLLVAAYGSDRFNNWLNTEQIDAIDQRTRMTLDAEGGITYQAFLMTEKLFSYETRINMAGNTIDDWEEAAYGTKSKRPAVKPIFEGGLSKTIQFDPVVSTAPAEGQPTGTIVGRGVMGQKHHGGKIHVQVDEASMVQVIAHIVPKIDYTQGNNWQGEIRTMEDLHNPNKDKIGYQDLPTDEMAWWDTKIGADGVLHMRSAGKQLSWTQYQTDVNENYALFAEETEGWMVNNRNYEADAEQREIKDLTAYIDPAKWNDIFAYKNRDAMNYRMQYWIGAKIEMQMSANQVPGL